MKEEVFMSDDATRLDILERMLDGFNRHDLDTIMSLFAEDCVFESPRGPDPWGRRFAGKAEVRAGLGLRFEGIPDVHYGEGDHFVLPGAGAARCCAPPEAQTGYHVYFNRPVTPTVQDLPGFYILYDGGVHQAHNSFFSGSRLLTVMGMTSFSSSFMATSMGSMVSSISFISAGAPMESWSALAPIIRAFSNRVSFNLPPPCISSGGAAEIFIPLVRLGRF